MSDRTRMSKRWTMTCMLLAVATTAPAALAQSQEAEDRRDQATMDSILGELEQLRDENAKMKLDMDELRAASSDDWLTEQRAEEIRGLVTDVLADADVRANLQGAGMTAGWSEHFFLASSDGRFKLELGGLLQVRYMLSWANDPVNDTDRTRGGFEKITDAVVGQPRLKARWRRRSPPRRLSPTRALPPPSSCGAPHAHRRRPPARNEGSVRDVC